MDLLVVDTNIFINALFSDAFVFDLEIMDLEEKGIVQFAFSKHTLDELHKIMARTIEQHNIFECYEFFRGLNEIVDRSIIASNIPKLEKLSSDKGDQPFIELAVKANANYLITNDYQNGLLDLGEYRGVKILTSSQYVRMVRKNVRRVNR